MRSDKNKKGNEADNKPIRPPLPTAFPVGEITEIYSWFPSDHTVKICRKVKSVFLWFFRRFRATKIR